MGTVSAACLAARGHSVVGVDPQTDKVRAITAGLAPIVERDVQSHIAEAIAAGRLSATGDAGAAVAATDTSLVCVGTPSATNGSLDVRAIEGACREIGRALRHKQGPHTIVIRSTILPGTFRRVIVPAIEAVAGKTAGRDFGIGLNPEFLREGSAVADFMAPAKTVIGADDAAVADLVAELYAGLPGVTVRTTPEIAEFVKYVDNSWHALKVSFANEVGNLCKVAGVDSHAVMDIFGEDRKLNISTAYLRPGFAFGGSCLPKDLRAITHMGRSLDLDLPVLGAILRSNTVQIDRAVEWILAQGFKRIGVLGCSFKAGTDDLRESPFIILIERLIGKGCDVRVFDENVHLASLVGANRNYLTAAAPHVSRLLVPSAEEAIRDADLAILTVSSPAYEQAIMGLQPSQTLLDFARIDAPGGLRARYEGINW